MGGSTRPSTRCAMRTSVPLADSHSANRWKIDQ
jgi:hypothetical protein